MILNEDYRDILAFNAEHVDFILVGAYALAAYGYPRATMVIESTGRAKDRMDADEVKKLKGR